MLIIIKEKLKKLILFFNGYRNIYIFLNIMSGFKMRNVDKYHSKRGNIQDITYNVDKKIDAVINHIKNHQGTLNNELKTISIFEELKQLKLDIETLKSEHNISSEKNNCGTKELIHQLKLDIDTLKSSFNNVEPVYLSIDQTDIIKKIIYDIKSSEEQVNYLKSELDYNIISNNNYIESNKNLVEHMKTLEQQLLQLTNL